MSELRFGTDGVRGEAGRWPITAEGAVRVGRAAAALAGPGGRVVIARDPRPSGAMLEAGVAAGAASSGAAVSLMGVLPTASVPVVLATGLAEAGVVITASHNPAADNGFKVFGPDGAKPDDALVARIEALLAAPPEDGPVGPIEAAPSLAATYRAALGAAFGEVGSLNGRRVGLDTARGAGDALVDWLRDALPGASIEVLDGEGPINEGCGAVHPERLAARVREGRLDAGIALDGDADRCVLVDERGEVVHGDALTWCLARDLGLDGLAVTVMSNAALELALPGVIVHRTPVGDRHLQAAMRAHGLLLGAEESGHVLFGDFPGGDGMLTGVRALAAAWRAAPTLSAAVRGFLPWPDARAKVRVSRRPPLQSLDGYDERVAAATARLAGGRVLLRYSGTEPILRVLVEGPDAAVVAAVRDELAAWAVEVLA